MMDLREFLKVLEEEHELQKIKVEVDPKHELGAICKIHNERPNSPALLFENVKGSYDSGGRPIAGERPTRGAGLGFSQENVFQRDRATGEQSDCAASGFQRRLARKSYLKAPTSISPNCRFARTIRATAGPTSRPVT